MFTKKLQSALLLASLTALSFAVHANGNEAVEEVVAAAEFIDTDSALEVVVDENGNVVLDEEGNPLCRVTQGIPTRVNQNVNNFISFISNGKFGSVYAPTFKPVPGGSKIASESAQETTFNAFKNHIPAITQFKSYTVESTTYKPHEGLNSLEDIINPSLTTDKSIKYNEALKQLVENYYTFAMQNIERIASNLTDGDSYNDAVKSCFYIWDALDHIVKNPDDFSFDVNILGQVRSSGTVFLKKAEEFVTKYKEVDSDNPGLEGAYNKTLKTMGDKKDFLPLFLTGVQRTAQLSSPRQALFFIAPFRGSAGTDTISDADIKANAPLLSQLIRQISPTIIERVVALGLSAAEEDMLHTGIARLWKVLKEDDVTLAGGESEKESLLIHLTRLYSTAGKSVSSINDSSSHIDA